MSSRWISKMPSSLGPLPIDAAELPRVKSVPALAFDASNDRDIVRSRI